MPLAEDVKTLKIGSKICCGKKLGGERSITLISLGVAVIIMIKYGFNFIAQAKLVGYSKEVSWRNLV